MRSSVFSLNDNACMRARRRTVGHNFSGISATHNPPTGMTRTSYIREGDNITVRWLSTVPYHVTPAYSIHCMDSVTRMAVATSLINRDVSEYTFQNSDGLLHWVHMHSSALSFSTSAFLSMNDITVREWAGFDTRYEEVHLFGQVAGLKDMLFGGSLRHFDIKGIYSGWNHWDLNCVSEYYSLLPYDNNNWLTYSPVPVHCTVQWIDKLGLAQGSVPKTTTDFRHLGHCVSGISVPSDAGSVKMHAICSLEIPRQLPALMLQSPSNPRPYGDLMERGKKLYTAAGSVGPDGILGGRPGGGSDIRSLPYRASGSKGLDIGGYSVKGLAGGASGNESSRGSSRGEGTSCAGGKPDEDTGSNENRADCITDKQGDHRNAGVYGLNTSGGRLKLTIPLVPPSPVQMPQLLYSSILEPDPHNSTNTDASNYHITQ